MSLRKFPKLVVDQNPLTRWVLGVHLAENGHVVREAASAADMRRILQSGPHLLLLDPLLPDVRGLDLLFEVRRDHPDSLVIALATFWSPELRRQAGVAAPHYVIEKPIEVQSVMQLVNGGSVAGLE